MVETSWKLFESVQNNNFDSLKWLAALGFNQIVNHLLNCISVMLCNKTLAFDVLKLKCFVTALLLKVPPNLTG
ncbi:hypothetical protein I79_006691 [Cricetulus griseus]|uniref:Uncharacterized protein n=1 Tax=Cricetulus griseus TaxID=10029 RepID=G3H8I9_CRIGR|nr:hypothetical protein I79_006691 [Cricetulus griseus]